MLLPFLQLQTHMLYIWGKKCFEKTSYKNENIKINISSMFYDIPFMRKYLLSNNVLACWE